LVLFMQDKENVETQLGLSPERWNHK
jgi:hypothetical protein